MHDVLPLTLYQDGVYVCGELWEYWRETFPRPHVFEMFAFVMYDIDDEHVEFVRSLAWRGASPLV
jgi:hypothetical protein